MKRIIGIMFAATLTVTFAGAIFADDLEKEGVPGQEMEDVPSGEKMINLPTDTQMKDLPSGEKMINLPTDTQMKDLPSDTEMKDLPTNKEQDQK